MPIMPTKSPTVPQSQLVEPAMRMPVSDGGRSRRRNAGPGASGDESRHALGRRSHAKIPYVRQGTLPSVELWQQIR